MTQAYLGYLRDAVLKLKKFAPRATGKNPAILISSPSELFNELPGRVIMNYARFINYAIIMLSQHMTDDVAVNDDTIPLQKCQIAHTHTRTSQLLS